MPYRKVVYLALQLILLCMDVYPHCLAQWMSGVGFVTSWIKLKCESFIALDLGSPGVV